MFRKTLLGFLTGLLLTAPVLAHVQTITTPLRKLYSDSFRSSDVPILDQQDFPIKVYISPLIETDYLAGSQRERRTTPLLLPQSSYLSLRQAVLDWSRILVSQPGSEAKEENFTVALKQSTSEADLSLLTGLGVFTFVTNREQADLAIIPVEASGIGVRGDILGVFSPVEEYPLGKIRISVLNKKKYVTEGRPARFLEEPASDFFMRSVMIHEIGHGLGFKHVLPRPDYLFDNIKDKCNIMYPTEYTCESPIPECQSEPGSPARCRGLKLSQVKRLESQITTPSARRSPALLSYVQQIDKMISAQLPVTSQPGFLTLKLNKKGEVQEAKVTRTFGSAQLDEQVNSLARKASPYGILPEEYKESELRFTLAYPSSTCQQGYKNEVIRRVNTVFTATPTAPGQVEVRLNGSGELLGYKLLKSFGSKQLDQQYLAAVETPFPLPAHPQIPAREELVYLLNYDKVPPQGPGIEACLQPDWVGYVDKITKRINSNFKATSKQFRRVFYTFTVNRKGVISDIQLLPNAGSDDETVDQAALSAIQTASPLEPLPANYSGEQIQVRFSFYLDPPAKATTP